MWAPQVRLLVSRFTPFGGRSGGRVYQRPAAPAGGPRYTALQETRVD